jgi:hypothetical protein
MVETCGTKFAEMINANRGSKKRPTVFEYATKREDGIS